MPGGIYKDVSQEERRRLAEQRYLELIGGLAEDGGVLGGPPITSDILDEELLHPEAASRAADAAAVAPQEYGETSPTLLNEPDDPEPMVDGVDRRLEEAYQLRQGAGAPPAPAMDPIDVELLPPPGAASERAHVDAAMRQGLPPPPPPSTAERFAENLNAVNAASPPVTPPPGGETERSLTPEVSRGERPDLYGHDDEGGFTRAEAIARARAAYPLETARREAANRDAFDRARAAGTESVGANTMRTPTPDALPNPYGPSESRWEDEFLGNHEALTDRQIRTRTALIGIFGGAIGGDPTMARDYANREYKVRAGYDEGLAEARGRDKGEQRIDQGLAEAIAATGNVSPEEASRLTYNSPLVAAYQNGMYAQGLSAERLERMAQQFQQGEQGKTLRSREQTAADERQNAVRAATQLSVAGQYAQKRGQTVPSADEQARGVMTNLQLSHTRLSEEAARRVAYDDDLSLVPEQEREHVRAVANQARQLSQTYKGLDDMARARIDDPKGEVRQQQAIEATIAKAQQDPDTALKFETNWEDSAEAFRRAHQAWQDLSPEGKANFVTWGRQGFVSEMLSDALTDRGDQEKFAAIAAVVNPLVKDRAGSAVTGSEWHRIGLEIGMPAGDFRPLNSPGVVSNWLDFTGRALTRHRQQYESVMKGWKGRR